MTDCRLESRAVHESFTNTKRNTVCIDKESRVCNIRAGVNCDKHYNLAKAESATINLSTRVLTVWYHIFRLVVFQQGKRRWPLVRSLVGRYRNLSCWLGTPNDESSCTHRSSHCPMPAGSRSRAKLPMLLIHSWQLMLSICRTPPSGNPFPPHFLK